VICEGECLYEVLYGPTSRNLVGPGKHFHSLAPPLGSPVEGLNRTWVAKFGLVPRFSPPGGDALMQKVRFALAALGRTM
jgi:hypothetical protein